MSGKSKRGGKSHKQHNGIYDEEFVVETILAKKVIDNITQYKVKWQGYPLSQSTWEPVSHLANVKDMIMDFEFERLKTDRSRELSMNDIPKAKMPTPRAKIAPGDLELDIPVKVVSARKVNSKIICIVEWKQRLDGIRPQNSELLADDLKENYIDLLLDFYESKITFT